MEGGRVVGLDLSGSRLAPGVLGGTVPDALGQLSALKSLDLSYNAFSGAIPTALGLLAGLENLDLSSNRLTGAIPEELARLPGLRAFNVENNRLTGLVPWAYRDRLIEDGLVVLYGGNAIDGLASPPPRGMPPVFSVDPSRERQCLASFGRLLPGTAGVGANGERGGGRASGAGIRALGRAGREHRARDGRAAAGARAGDRRLRRHRERPTGRSRAARHGCPPVRRCGAPGTRSSYPVR